MFNSKTVFVIGAGASAEADLPVGNKLTDIIARLTNFYMEAGSQLKSGDPQIYNALKHVVDADREKWANNNLIASGRKIAEAMELAPSIDTFLETHSDKEEFILIGKLGITKAILRAERASKFAPIANGAKPFRISTIADTWYRSLAQQLFSGVPANKPNEAFANVSFIVFNYDRCLEVFLTRAVEVYFGMSQEDASDIVAEVEIVHPYGSLGSLRNNADGFVPFGSENYDLHSVAAKIRTFSESVDDENIIHRVRTEVKEAETLVFLGFGFHNQNLDLLSDAVPRIEKTSAIQKVLATTFRLSESDTKIVRSQIGYMLKGKPLDRKENYSIDTFNGTCSNFFDEYWRTLTA